VGSGQVLHCPYPTEKARLAVQEMADQLALNLVDKGLVTDQLVLTVGYDIDNLKDSDLRKRYHGAITTDHYGREVPKHAHGTQNLGKYTSSTKLIMGAVSELYDRIVDPALLIRRVYLSANHIVEEDAAPKDTAHEQLDLFTDYKALHARQAQEDAALKREKSRQQVILSLSKKFGKNAVLRGMNLEEGATTVERNGQIGGHKA
jgi:DNA polymerase V